MRLSLIVAMSENRVIGREGQLPWRLSADLRRFKQLTMGHHLIMGRKTWESIGRPLPGRTSLVISRNPEYRAEGAVVLPDLPHAMDAASGDDEVFVIGGGQIYRQALPQADRVYLTLIHASIAGDTHFPELEPETWCLAEEPSRHPDDHKNEYPYSFLVYQRAVRKAI
jgi:dihydrofolate reductase